jgi:hypothetical protein
MSILINPGAHIGPADEGWTNTYEGALREAERWLERMREDGIGADIDLVIPAEPVEHDGRWTFGFRHRVTGVTVELDTHGISDMAACTRRHIFGARVYWNGSSCSNPELEHWSAPGFVMTFRPDGAQ